MTEHYSFFDAVQDSNGHYDREYNAQQFTDYFKSLVTTGVMKGAYNQLEVTANGANMVSSVKSGVAFVEGRYYYNDTLLELTHDTEVVGLSRIDRVVVRLDLNTENRYVRIFIKKGSPNSNPVAPTLTRTSLVYEISLAQIKVIGGQTYINTIDVKDERGNKDICPWAGSRILPNFSDTSIGEPNGIATLDENGKIPQSQLDIKVGRVSVRRTLNANIPSGTNFVVPFDTVDYDTNNFFRISSPTRLTIPKGVSKIKVTANVYVDGGFLGRYLETTLKKNGTTVVGQAYDAFFGTASASIVSGRVETPIISVTEGDYLELSINHSSEGAMSLSGTLNKTFMNLEVIE